MDRNKLVASSAFRLSLIYAVLFSAAALLAIMAITRYTNDLLIEQAHDTVDAELRGLAEQYRLGGIQQLTRIIAERSELPADSLYLVADAQGRRVAGNLASVTEALLAATGRVRFTYRRSGASGPELREALASAFRLPGDFRLVVGRDIAERRAFQTMVRDVLLISLLAIAAIAIAGGLILALRLRRRIDAMSAASRRIMAGDLTQRIPMTGSGDEFDGLAASLNAMIARIEELMSGLREVSDNIAHDLKTPLTRLRNRLETTLRGGDAAQFHGAIEETLEEADELIRTFNALLSIARLEAGARDATYGRFDLATVIADVAELYEPLADERGLRLTVAPMPALLVEGEPQLVAQAIANLVDNAIKYAGDGEGGSAPGSVAISAALTPDGAEIVVADNGPGIAPADRDRACRRFVRLETSRSAPGSGLGLSLVAAVMRLHGGTVQLADNAPGLKVTLRLPAAAAAMPGSAAAA